jgi:hypothetical protein
LDPDWTNGRELARTGRTARLALLHKKPKSAEAFDSHHSLHYSLAQFFGSHSDGALSFTLSTPKTFEGGITDTQTLHEAG